MGKLFSLSALLSHLLIIAFCGIYIGYNTQSVISIIKYLIDTGIGSDPESIFRIIMTLVLYFAFAIRIILSIIQIVKIILKKSNIKIYKGIVNSILDSINIIIIFGLINTIYTLAISGNFSGTFFTSDTMIGYYIYIGLSLVMAILNLISTKKTSTKLVKIITGVGSLVIELAVVIFVMIGLKDLGYLSGYLKTMYILAIPLIIMGMAATVTFVDNTAQPDEVEVVE